MLPGAQPFSSTPISGIPISFGFVVRVFGYAGNRQIRQLSQPQFTDRSSKVLDEPYQWAQNATTQGGVPVSIPAVPADRAGIVVIEIPDGQSIRCEFNTVSRVGGAFVAGPVSQKLTGIAVLPWEAGTSLSIIDGSFYQ